MQSLVFHHASGGTRAAESSSRRYMSSSSSSSEVDRGTNKESKASSSTDPDHNRSPADGQPPIHFVSGTAYIPHPEKDGNGEDAHFVSNNGLAVGVADGVGGWADLGVDSGKFSRELMMQCKYFQEAGDMMDPREILTVAFDSTTCIGTSTACLLALQDHMLRTANIGDSSFLLLRKGEGGDKNSPGGRKYPVWKLVYQAPEQQHYFNCPLQLGTNSRDKPEHAQTFNLPCEPGDLILVATDGLFDNLFIEDILMVLEMHSQQFFHKLKRDLAAVGGGGDPDTNQIDIIRPLFEVLDREQLTDLLDGLAMRLTSAAHEAGHDHVRRSPFAANARRAGFRYEGGKLDDCTVVASYVVPHSYG